MASAEVVRSGVVAAASAFHDGDTAVSYTHLDVYKRQPARMAANALKYTDCMRSHGEPNFPDPNGEGMITINPTGILDPNSSQFQKAEKECQGQNNGDFDEQFTSSHGG